jgi:hypothetical protein
VGPRVQQDSAETAAAARWAAAWRVQRVVATCAWFLWLMASTCLSPRTSPCAYHPG